MSTESKTQLARLDAILVAGHPTDAELAALSAVLLTLDGTPESPDEAPPANSQAWASRSRQLRVPPTPGPGAWRASARS